MKASLFITGLLLVYITAFSQQNQIITAVPNLGVFDLQLTDQNGNNTIEANETCYLTFLLKNSGGEPAQSVKIRLSLVSPEDLDIKYRKNRALSIVNPGGEEEMKFPIAAGEHVGDGTAEFRIDISEINGFDAYPVTVEIKTAQGEFIKKDLSDEAMAEIEGPSEIAYFNLSDPVFADENQNGKLEAFEEGQLTFRLFNVSDQLRFVTVKVSPEDGSVTGIDYPRSSSFGFFGPLEWKDVSIPLKGKKNLQTGIAEIKVQLQDEGVESNYKHISFPTLEYETPVLRISNVEFFGKKGKEIKLNESFGLRFDIENLGRSPAFSLDVEPRFTNQNVRLSGSKKHYSLEEIPAGESASLDFSLIALRGYPFLTIPVIVEVTENYNDLYVDSVLVASILPPKVDDKQHTASVTTDAVTQNVEAGTEPQQEEQQEEQGQEPAGTEAPAVSFQPPFLELHDHEFIDQDKNQIINPKESCSIRFKVSNKGAGNAQDLSVRIKQLNNDVNGLSFPEQIDLGVLENGQETTVDIPVRSSGTLPSGIAEFRIEVLEARGFDATPLLFEVRTQKLLEPSLSIVQARFVDESGQLRKNYPVELKVSIENRGQGDASDVRVQFELPSEDCIVLGDAVEEYQIKKLRSGESSDISLSFIATRRYANNQIPVKVGITESYNKYGMDTVLVGEFAEQTAEVTKISIKPVVIEPVAAPEKKSPEQESRVQASADEPVTERESTEPGIEETEAGLRGGGDPLRNLAYEEALREMKIGRYFALIIGIDEYSGEWPPLRNAVHDAKAMAVLLDERYKFDHFSTLYNSMATRQNIIRELEWLVRNVTPDDNILIYYSGHGDYKKELNKGFWVPYEARTKSTADFISNSVIQDFLSSINSRHTLLISDACFSGDIFRGETLSIPFVRSERYYTTVHSKPSRQAITSGDLEPVLDGGREGHSVFAYYLLKYLGANEDKFFDAFQLYGELKIAVVNNSNQTPIFQHIKNTGDEGGQFIFIRK